MSAAVGADVESLCSTCGDVWHVVVAKVGDAIVKVQCKQCGKVHKPKPLPGSAAAKAPRRASSSASRPTAPTRKVPTTHGTTVAIPIEIAFDPLKPSRPYGPGETFTPGEQMSHPTFGSGVVESVPAPGKVRVVFGDAIRVLVQARPGSQLERPAPRPVVVDAEEEEEA